MSTGTRWRSLQVAPAIAVQQLDTNGKVTDRDLESDRDLEHFVEPHNPAFSRHNPDRAPPKIHMAPTNSAKSDREEAIQRALEKRGRENKPFDDLALEFGIPKTKLFNRFRGMTSWQKAHKKYQVLSRSMEDALLQWASELEDRKSVV